MKFRSGICIECGREGQYAKPSLSLCPVCNGKRLESKRPRLPLASSNSEKPVAKLPPQKRRKSTGEAVMFRAIWSTRKHICINCKDNLGNEAKTFFFAHILPKSRYPEKRLDPNNIMLLCFDCHREYDQGTKENYSKRSRL